MSSQSVSRHNSDGVAGAQPAHLPVTRDLKLVRTSSFIIALIAAAVSVVGIIYRTSLYQTEEMLLLKVPTDLFTLIVAVPVLLASIWLARRGRLLGLLCWPAPLLYMLYIYLANAIGVPLSFAFLAYVTIAGMSTYTLIGLVASIDAKAVQHKLTGTVPERFAGASSSVSPSCSP